MEERIKKLRLSKKQRGEIRKKVKKWDKNHLPQNKQRQDYRWHIVEVKSKERSYLYCVRIKSSESLGEDLSTARWMAAEEHKRLYSDKSAFKTNVLGYIESFISED